nr:PAS domain-containing protein [Deltaproteobacteria bacterium]
GITKVFGEALAGLGNRLGVDRCTVYVLTLDRRGFRPVASWAVDGVQRSSMIDFRDLTPRLVADALQGNVLRIPEVEALDDSMARDRSTLLEMGMKSMLAIPLQVGGATVGGVSVGGLRRAFSWPRRLVGDLAPVAAAFALGLDRLGRYWELERARVEHDETQRLAGVAHWRYSFAIDTIQGSPQLYRMFEIDPRMELDMPDIERRVHADDREAFMRQISALLSGRPCNTVECRLLRRHGGQRWLRCWGEIRSDSEGQPAFAHGIMQDVTERKRIRLALENTNRRLIHAQEQERARLGREIHDDLGQRLAVLKLGMCGATTGTSTGTGGPAADASPGMEELIEQVDEVSMIVRGLSHSLHPAHLLRLGLARSLQTLCREASQFSEVDVHLEVGALPDSLSDDVVLTLYRVSQESVSNATKHAGARGVWLRLRGDKSRLELSIVDDGCGFDPDELSDRAGLGLLGMRERVRLVGGELRVRSRLGLGTRIEAVVAPRSPSVSERAPR